MLATVFLHVEIDRPVHLVGITGSKNLLDHLRLFQDMSGGGGFDARRQCVELLQHLMETNGVFLYDLHRFQLFQFRFLGELVISLIAVTLKVSCVGDVAHVADLVSQVQEIAVDQIE